ILYLPLDRSAHRQLQSARWRGRVWTHLRAAELEERRGGSHLCARRGILTERAPLVEFLLSRVHVSSLADGARLYGFRYRLSRQRRLRSRLASWNLPSHGR